MVLHTKHISDFFSRKDKWIILSFYALCLTLFLMPFPRSWSLWSLAGFLFFGLMEWIYGFKAIQKNFIRQIIMLIPPVAYFVLHMIYAIFDPKWVYLEHKLMFILIPVLGYPFFMSDYASKNINKIITSFIFGILLICLFLFLRALWESISFTDGVLKFQPFVDQKISRFNWDQLSIFEHPTYLAIKTLWAITLTYLCGNQLRLSKTVRIPVILLLSIFIFFLSSRSGIIILTVLWIYFLFLRIKTVWLRIALPFLIPLFLFGAFKLTTLNKRMNSELNEIKDKFTVENFDWKNVHYRTRSWYSALMLIKENPVFGVGLDARTKLTEEYERRGFIIEAEWRLNAHNQYLETQLTFGIFGTILLFWMLLAPLFKRKQLWQPSLILPFLIIISISMLFESILVRQWGIMFFVIFYCILIIPHKNTLISNDT